MATQHSWRHGHVLIKTGCELVIHIDKMYCHTHVQIESKHLERDL